MEEKVGDVTVIAVCFNHSRFLLDSLLSISNQSLTPRQVVIVDDASTDGSAELIAEWASRQDRKPILILHKENIGLCASLNEALALVETTYISYVSTDDLLESSKLEVQLNELAKCDQKVAVIYSDSYLIDESGVQYSETHGQRLWWFDRPPEGSVFRDLLKQNFIPAPSALIRVEAIRAAGGYDETLPFEDWDMWLRLAKTFEFKYSNYVSSRHRLLADSLYHSRRIELAQAKIRLLRKWLTDTNNYDAVTGRIRQEILYLYAADRRIAIPYLADLRRLRPGFESDARYLLARWGLPYRVERVLTQNRKRINRLLHCRNSNH